MDNGLREPQTIVLLGGTSDIGRAIVSRLAGPTTRTIVLACRRPDEAKPETFSGDGVEVDVVHFEATDTDGHERFVSEVARRHGDLDVVVMAFGILGDQSELEADPSAAAELAAINYSGSVSCGLAVARQLRRQGHGKLVVLSSVAGERARRANFVYGSSKAGLDVFAQGLGDSLQGTGAGVLVVRPGFVHSRMTQGSDAAPFATTPDKVAKVTAAGLRAGRHTVWAPPLLRYVFSALRHLPRGLFRRLPVG